jgi:hypothetical protein
MPALSMISLIPERQNSLLKNRVRRAIPRTERVDGEDNQPRSVDEARES